MGDGVTAAARHGGGRTRRLSPKVRRLLREQGLDASQVEGTGVGGRITPSDVQRRAGTDGRARPAQRPGRGARPVLASPLARRLLRDAGVDPRRVVGTGPGSSITRRDAARAIDEARAPTTTDDVATLEVEVDLTRLLLGVAAARDVVRRRTGVELTPLAPVVHAACRSLRRHPVCNGSPAPRDDEPTEQRDVDLGVVTGGGEVLSPMLACAQDLTVTALAERIARLREGDGGRGDPGTFTVRDGPEATLAWDRQAAALALGPVEQRSVTIADEFGHDAVTTRWQATLQLAHDPRRIDDRAAAAFLDDLRRELESVDLLAGVA